MKYVVIPCLVILAVAIIFAAGCTGQQSPPSVGGQSPALTGTIPPTIAHSGGTGVTVSIRMKENSFDPNFVTVKVGTTIRWTNEDSRYHTVTYTGTGATRFDSGRLAKGESFSNTFTEPGRYIYADTQHASMTGTILVE